jgi:hypothetical protein
VCRTLGQEATQTPSKVGRCITSGRCGYAVQGARCGRQEQPREVMGEVVQILRLVPRRSAGQTAGIDPEETFVGNNRTAGVDVERTYQTTALDASVGAESAPRSVASGRTGIRAIAVIHCGHEIGFAAPEEVAAHDACGRRKHGDRQRNCAATSVTRFMARGWEAFATF